MDPTSTKNVFTGFIGLFYLHIDQTSLHRAPASRLKKNYTHLSCHFSCLLQSYLFCPWKHSSWVWRLWRLFDRHLCSWWTTSSRGCPADSVRRVWRFGLCEIWLWYSSSLPTFTFLVNFYIYIEALFREISSLVFVLNGFVTLKAHNIQETLIINSTISCGKQFV